MDDVIQDEAGAAGAAPTDTHFLVLGTYVGGSLGLVLFILVLGWYLVYRCVLIRLAVVKEILGLNTNSSPQQQGGRHRSQSHTAGAGGAGGGHNGAANDRRRTMSEAPKMRRRPSRHVTPPVSH